MRIDCKSCFAVDALCAVAQGKRCRNSLPSVRKLVVAASSGAAILDTWTLSTILSVHMRPERFERLKLDDLIELAPSWMADNELLAAYAADTGASLLALRDSGFEAAYRDQCLPLVDEWIERLSRAFESMDLESFRGQLAAICPAKTQEGLRVYVSYFSYPDRFLLSDHMLVSSCRAERRIEPKPILHELTHELLHGTVPQRVLGEYTRLCRDDPFLARTRVALTKQRGGLDEEELVTGLGLYLDVHNGWMEREEALYAFGAESAYTMPVALLLFETLTREGLPSHLEVWMLGFLDELRGGVEAAAEKVSPGYARAFERGSRREQRPETMVRSFLF